MKVVPVNPSFETKDYATIGRIYAKENPDSAKQLIEKYNQVQQKAIDEDFHNLNYYYLSFCKIHSIDPFDFLGQLHIRERVEKRRLFIGTMIRIYKPELLKYDINAKTGFAESLCIILRFDNGNISKTIDEAVKWMQGGLYGFNEEIENTIQRLVDVQTYYVPGGLFEDLIKPAKAVNE